MAQYDVHQMDGGTLVVDIQAEILSGFNTRIVVPLLPREDAPAPVRQLNPEVVLDGQTYVLATQYLSAVRLSELSPAIGSLKPLEHRVSLSLDLLLHGV